MKSYKGLKEYSAEYDALMNTHLEIIQDAYNYTNGTKRPSYLSVKKEDYLLYPRYSIKLPNNMTGLRLVECMDGDQPVYDNTAYLNMLEHYDLHHDKAIADCPRHGDAKRIFYHDLEKAYASLHFLKKLYNTTEEQH